MLNHGETNSAGVTPNGFTDEIPFNYYQVPFINSFPFSAIGNVFLVTPSGASEPPGDYVRSGR
jgi:hypothetical protein